MPGSASIPRAIAGGRVLEQQRPHHAHQEEDDTQYAKGHSPADALDECFGHRDHDRGSTAVSCDHQADDESPLVGKPLRADGNGRGIAKTVAETDDETEGDIQIGERAGEAGEDEAQTRRASRR